MSEHRHDNGFGFPHDGEHGRNCTGFGCDCDHENYPISHHRSSSSGTPHFTCCCICSTWYCNRLYRQTYVKRLVVMKTVTDVVVWVGLALTIISLVDYVIKNKQVLTQGGM